MTLHTIGLFVAGCTTFQRLPRGFAVVEEKRWLRIVEPRFQPPRRTHATLLVTVPAEARGIMAVRALQVPVVGRAAMPLHEVGWMITATEIPYWGTAANCILKSTRLDLRLSNVRCINDAHTLDIPAVASLAFCSGVAPCAGQRLSGSQRAVVLLEETALMRSRRASHCGYARRTDLCAWRQYRRGARRGTSMTGRTTLARMATSARRDVGASCRAVLVQPVRAPMRCGYKVARSEAR